MKIVSTLAVIGALAFAQPAFAQLEAYKDYDVKEATAIVTTVKVDSNMIDYYLEGLKTAWAPSNDVSKSLGQIEDYNIYVSQLPNSGDFNVILVVSFKNTADIGPSKERYEAFMAEWGSKRQKESRTIAKTYPDIRTITGSYLMNEVTFNK
ncbi:MAG: hypothetical protein EX271_08145 [Acidimicrobiales bacterium]|nr:hypothetical protein [Hyphomonadaceae bacterium]RZV41390.1 MAG: hypothetical protein EX271_08145 [Acidimicrobiales bacterium]